MGPEVPTRYPDNPLIDPDVLDVIVYNDRLNSQITQQVLVEQLGSDHRPVVVTLDQQPSQIAPPAPRPQPDWTLFSGTLETTTPTRPISSPADVDELAAGLTACIRGALEAARTSPRTQERPPRLPTHILNLMAAKKRLRRQWQRTRCPTMKAELNRLGGRVKAEIYTYQAESWEDHIVHIRDDWPSIHKLCRRLTNTPAPVRPLLHEDGAPRYQAADRAGILARHLERQFTPNPSDEHDHVAAVDEHLRHYFESPIASDENPIAFSPGMVQRAIRRTKKRKAPGVDGITNTALQHLPFRTVAALARLFTGIVRTGSFPNIWKEGRVVMLPKPGKNILKPESYRPITLLPTMSKVFEQLLLRHLTPHVTPRPEQFGFRSDHSTTLQLSRVLHGITAARNKREHAVAVFLDIEKAFDRVWHAGLLYKLATSQVPRRIVKVVSTFLSDRTFRVAVEDAISPLHPILAGVPQGSCLSPALYSCYTDDIPVAEGTQLALYADDAAYIATSLNAKHAASKMQKSLDLLPQWLARWRLSVNVGKTQAITISTKRKLPPPLLLHMEPIPWKPSVTYLGVTLDRRLSMRRHVSSVVAKARVTRALLRPVLSSNLPPRVKLNVYKLYVRSQLTYAAPAWFALTSEASRTLLRQQQSATLRKVVNAPRYVRNDVIQRDLRVESLDDFVKSLTRRLFERADTSAWSHIRGLAPWHARPPDRHKLPRDLLADGPTTT